MLEESVKLLPTPAAGLHNYEESVESFTARQQALKAKGINGNGSGTPLPIAIKLLPTPVAGDGREKGGGGRWSPTSAPLEQTIKDETVKLLPTPTTADSRNSRNATANGGEGSTGHSGTTLSDLVHEWSEESGSSGETSSPPSDAGKASTDLRLSPWFVEWMMGMPDGWSDPDVELSAHDFQRLETASRCRSAGSPASTSCSLSDSGEGN